MFTAVLRGMVLTTGSIFTLLVQAAPGAITSAPDGNMDKLAKTIVNSISTNDFKVYKQQILTADDVQYIIRKIFEKDIRAKSRNVSESGIRAGKVFLSHMQDRAFAMSSIGYHRIVMAFYSVRSSIQRKRIKFGEIQYSGYEIEQRGERRVTDKLRVRIYFTAGGKKWRLQLSRVMKTQQGNWALGGYMYLAGEVKQKSSLPK